MVMVVDQSEEASSTGKKKTKKGKKVKIAGKAAQEGGGGMTNGGGEDAGADTGAVQDGAVIDDPETLERFEVGQVQVGPSPCSANVFINILHQSLDPSEMANGVTAASADDIQDHIAQGEKHATNSACAMYFTGITCND